jgi:1-deoxy-D-xylulose-5-phosphate reductoisomerase
VAVAAFLKREIGFTDISKVIERTMHETKDRHPESIEEVLAIDAEARELARYALSHQLTR